MLWGCPCGPETLLKAAGNIRVQQGLREKVDEGLKRAKPLMPKIVSILKRHEVPPELAALPLVESTYNPRARSKAGAVGLWQFMKSTGKRYLKITRKRDDRRDPLLATNAAARLLRHNFETLGSWPLAIVAYNHGSAGMMAASTSVGSRAIEDIIANYTGPRFGFASRNFYAEFLAALEVVHPLLNGQSRPVVAKTRRPAGKSATPAALPAAPPASVPEAPAPVEAQPVEASVPPVQPAAAEGSPVSVVPAPGEVSPPSVQPPVEASVPPFQLPVEVGLPSVEPPSRPELTPSGLTTEQPAAKTPEAALPEAAPIAPPAPAVESPFTDPKVGPDSPVEPAAAPAATPPGEPEPGTEAAAHTDPKPDDPAAAPPQEPSL
jgi:hypothetical protein